MTLPYENASSGERALADIQKTLQAFGCQSFGSMMDFENKKLLVQFKYRDRAVSIDASINGYAAAWLKRNPWTHRKHITKQAWEEKAIGIAGFAVYSILRDWIKGQITAIECGILSFEGAFLGQLLLPSGLSVMQHIQTENLLPAPKEKE